MGTALSREPVEPVEPKPEVQKKEKTDQASAKPPDAKVEVPTVITWSHGGNKVYVTGTFNGWKERIAMHRSGNEWNTIQTLKPGQYEYKFIVDNEWKFAPEQATTFDNNGNVNNLLEVTPYHSPLVEDDAFKFQGASSAVPWNQKLPSEDDFAREPPALPPHLFHTLLNTQVSSGDPLALPRPQHVTLNHVICSNRTDKGLVLGITQRYKNRFTTVIAYY